MPAGMKSPGADVSIVWIPNLLVCATTTIRTAGRQLQIPVPGVVVASGRSDRFNRCLRCSRLPISRHPEPPAAAGCDALAWQTRR